MYLQQAFVNRLNGKREVCCKKENVQIGNTFHYSLLITRLKFITVCINSSSRLLLAYMKYR